MTRSRHARYPQSGDSREPFAVKKVGEWLSIGAGVHRLPHRRGERPMEKTTTASVVSRDGTRITYDRVGSGPPLIVVSGALGLRKSSFVQPWVKALAQHFTVYNYDRRGRGDSGDATTYTV